MGFDLRRSNGSYAWHWGVLLNSIEKALDTFQQLSGLCDRQLDRWQISGGKFIAPSVKKDFYTQKVWDLGGQNLESGLSKSFEKGNILGPYSFPMVLSDQFPEWELFDTFYGEVVDFFQVDEHCYEEHTIRADPDEVVYVSRLELVCKLGNCMDALTEKFIFAVISH